jgi:hypothetical protein
MDFSWVKAFGKGLWALLLGSASLALVVLFNQFFDNIGTLVNGTVPVWIAPAFLLVFEMVRNYIKQHWFKS